MLRARVPRAGARERGSSSLPSVPLKPSVLSGGQELGMAILAAGTLLFLENEFGSYPFLCGEPLVRAGGRSCTGAQPIPTVEF